MKFKADKIILTFCFVFFMLFSNLFSNDVQVGKTYDVLRKVDLHSDSNENSSLLINQKSSDLLGEISYLSVDSSTTVKILVIKDNWLQVQVVEPEFLSKTHIGWIPSSSIKIGAKSSKKLDGWVKHTCIVFDTPKTEGNKIGFLKKGASIGVADDGSGWLKLIHGPVRDMNTKQYIDYENIRSSAFIEKINFNTKRP